MINKEELDFLGIKAFHEAGYKGQGITICSKENVIKNIFEDVFCIEPQETLDKYSQHGTTVMDYIRQVVPEANKLSVETSGTIKNNVLYSEGMDYLQKNTPDIITTSFFKSSDLKEPKQSLYKKLYDKGCFLCCCAGNEEEDGIVELANGDVWKAIGACKYNKGKPKRQNGYSVGTELDFMSFHNLYATWDKKRHKGTSFSAPLFAGMLALVQCFFLKNIGRKLNHEELLNFVKENCIDLEEEGHDYKTGYGLFILPNPKTINVKKYISEYQIEEEEEMRYQKIEEIPEYAKSTIQKLINKKILKGNDNGLDLSEDMIRMFVINDRVGLYE